MNHRARYGLEFRCKQQGINPGTSSPSPLLLKEKGTGVEVDKSKWIKPGTFSEHRLIQTLNREKSGEILAMG